MSTGGGKGGVKNEINVTPLVDVVLVLLIIFMVVTPMLQRGKDVKLPAAKQQKEKEKPKSDPLILSITPDKKIFVEQDEYPDIENFKQRLEREITSNEERPILLKGDMTLAFGEVRKVMNIARQARARAIQLGIEEIKEGAGGP